MMARKSQFQQSVSRCYRQGDILLLSVNVIPADARKEPRRSDGSILLGEGETVGHRHEIFDSGVDVYRASEGFYLEVAEEEKEVTLVHPEHGHLALAPGSYEVIVQREFFRKEFAPVVD